MTLLYTVIRTELLPMKPIGNNMKKFLKKPVGNNEKINFKSIQNPVCYSFVIPRTSLYKNSNRICIFDYIKIFKKPGIYIPRQIYRVMIGNDVFFCWDSGKDNI